MWRLSPGSFSSSTQSSQVNRSGGTCISGSLLESLDQTLTGMGGRMFANWLCMPLCNIEQIEQRQDAVEQHERWLDELAHYYHMMAHAPSASQRGVGA